MRNEEILALHRVKERNIIYTGLLTMYSGITKIFYRKTVGHLFTKPIQIEETTENFSSQ